MSTGIGQKLARMYEVPSPYKSDREYRQYFHEDLPTLDDEALKSEFRRVLHVLDWSRRPHPWLQERLDAVQAELQRRRQPQSKPKPVADKPPADKPKAEQKPTLVFARPLVARRR